MISTNQEQFEGLINQSMEELPQEYIKGLKNVVITVEDEPTAEQIQKMELKYKYGLFGLYEGIPMTRRNNNYSGVLPDKITIFKTAAELGSNDLVELKASIKNTLWHEIAHHYGLDHDRIESLESKK